ncbi:hypothetical protein [Flavobacterium sp.]|uniref:hypothetical protein n=1 Tax=Flavobacterium sp. TaxID=239 RepID=UPI001223D619|nr:hypothetical protein [Flavobacterium sp.]RZJ73197.1 MAG: hypothetical protein EOO49_02505 [Flavobacterium sp.]
MVTKFSKISFFTAIAILSALFSFANMAKPWVDGSKHSGLFTSTEAQVKHEKIDIELISKNDVFFGKYRVVYDIFVAKDIAMPLQFIGLELHGNPTVSVNGKIVETTIPPVTFASVSEYDRQTHEAKDEFRFDADLKSGRNQIVVSYQVNIEYGLTSLEREYTLRYAIYPAKYWKSFGPIEIQLKASPEFEFTKANIGQPKFDGKFHTWKIKASDVDELEISFVRRKSVLGKLLIFLEPGGIASVAFILFGFLNVRLLRKYPKKAKQIVWTGIFVAPTLFYLVFEKAYFWIDSALQQWQNHGYTFFYWIFWPLLALLYGLYLFWQKRRFEKIRQENT